MFWGLVGRGFRVLGLLGLGFRVLGGFGPLGPLCRVLGLGHFTTKLRVLNNQPFNFQTLKTPVTPLSFVRV